MHKAENLINNHKKFLNQMRLLLTEFGIRTSGIYRSGESKRKDGIVTIGLEFEISGTKNNLPAINNFKNKIGFESANKQEKLNKAITILSKAPASPRI